MAHPIRNHGSRWSERTDPRLAFGEDIGRGPDRGVVDFYDLHAEALYSLALLLCGDTATAERIVVESLLHAVGSAAVIEPDEMRTALASDVYGRSAETRRAMDCTQGRQPRPPSEGDPLAVPASPLPQQSWERRAILGLVLLGDHSYQQAAALLGVPAKSAARQLAGALVAMRSTYAGS